MPGDGVGPEVIAQALRVLECLSDAHGVPVSVTQHEFGVQCYAKHHCMITDDGLRDVEAADAVLFGAVGGEGYSDIPIHIRRNGGLVGLRRRLGLYVNLRPIKMWRGLASASSLKPDVVDGVDIAVLRELSSGLYYGEPRGVSTGANGLREAVNTLAYTEAEIERIARYGFELARRRTGRLCSVDKANVLETGQLWRAVVTELHEAEYSDVELTHLYVDNAAMQLVLRPKQFDVVVTSNAFGDILSDLGGAIAGSLGMLPSASFGAEKDGGVRPAFFEPVHGSAPDIAGCGIANPLGAILSLALVFRHAFGDAKNAERIEQAVEQVLLSGILTKDLARDGEATVGTAEMGSAVLDALDVG